MASRDRRLRKRADFVRVQHNGAAVRTRHFIMLLHARDDRALPTRMGIVATKKVGNAVVRNRIKRLCREGFRSLHASLLPEGLDFVVIPKPGAGELGLRDLEAEWQGASRKLRAECEKVLRARP